MTRWSADIKSAEIASGRVVADGHTADGHTADGHTADGHTADGHTADGHTVDGQRVKYMADSELQAASQEPPVDLRNSTFAAIVGWLIPGAGHIYQGRYGKGILYALCVLTTYFIGLSLGGGHVVYASWKKEDFRWQYVCQAGVGLPALPALLQSRRVMRGQEPFLADLLAPPRQPVLPNDADHLAEWHLEHKWQFDLGTLYTMIAGLLNILAVYDAYAGPFVAHALRAKASKDENEPSAAADRTSEKS